MVFCLLTGIRASTAGQSARFSNIFPVVASFSSNASANTTRLAGAAAVGVIAPLVSNDEADEPAPLLAVLTARKRRDIVSDRVDVVDEQGGVKRRLVVGGVGVGVGVVVVDEDADVVIRRWLSFFSS